MTKIYSVHENTLNEIINEIGTPFSNTTDLNGFLNRLNDGFAEFTLGYPSPIAIKATQMRTHESTSANGKTLSATGKGLLFIGGGLSVGSNKSPMSISNLTVDGKRFQLDSLGEDDNIFIEFKKSVTFSAKGKGYGTIMLF